MNKVLQFALRILCIRRPAEPEQPEPNQENLFKNFQFTGHLVDVREPDWSNPSQPGEAWLPDLLNPKS